MPKAIVDVSTIDPDNVVIDEDELRQLLPHAFEWQMVDHICHLDLEEGIVAGVKKWDDEPWWARGHIPGRPLMPGVLMVEGACQVATVLMKKKKGFGIDGFIGLAGLDKVRFRGIVSPPGTMMFVSRAGAQSGNRLAKYPAQAYCDGKLVMDMDLLGAPL